MDRSRPPRRTLLVVRTLVAVLLVLGVSLTAVAPLAEAANGSISITVYTPGSVPLAGAHVQARLSPSDPSPITMTADATGVANFTSLAPGGWQFVVDEPGWGQTNQLFVNIPDGAPAPPQAIYVDQAATVSVTVRIMQPDGSAIPAPSGVLISASPGQGTVAAPVDQITVGAGAITLQLIPGSWFLAPATADYLLPNPPPPLNVTLPGPLAATLDLSPILLSGQVVGPDGTTPVPTYNVQLFTADRSTFFPAISQPSSPGSFRIGGVNRSGVYYLQAQPPEYSTLLPNVPVPVTITVSGNTVSVRPTGPITLTLENAVKTVVGVVQRSDGGPIGSAQVQGFPSSAGGPGGDFFQTRTVTGTNAFTLPVKPGSWNVSVFPDPGQNPNADWVYTGAPQVATFLADSTVESKRLTLTVSAAPYVVTADVRLPDGSTPPAGTVFVNLSNKVLGFGRSEPVQPGGLFALRVPTGTYEIDIFSKDARFGRPAGLSPVVVLPSASSGVTVSIGTITLSQRTSTISGRIADSSGAGIPGINVSAWNRTSNDRSSAISAADGSYQLSVSDGTYDVDAFPSPGDHWARTGNVRFVTIAANQQIANVDFTLVRADAAVVVEAVDAGGALLTSADGFVNAVVVNGGAGSDGPNAGQMIGNGQPLRNGRATLALPALTNTVLSVGFPFGSAYLPAQSQPITTVAGTTKTVQIALAQPDAIVTGKLMGAAGTVTGVRAQVFAQGARSGSQAEVNPADGSYTLRVKSGSRIFLGLAIQSGQSWRWNPTPPPEVDLTTTKSASYDFKLEATTGKISGLVTDPSGSPRGGVFVDVTIPSSGATPPRFMGGMATGPDGRYEIQVTGNVTYEVRATISPDLGFVNPPAMPCFVGAAIGSSCLADLRFLTADATLAGTVYSGTVGGAAVQAFVRAWSENGGTAFGRTDASGGYRLNIATGAAGDVWHVSAVYQTEAQFAASQDYTVSTRPTDTSKAYQQDILLGALTDIPKPINVTFDATELKILQLSNGVMLTIPAGALATTGQVTVRAVPNPAIPKDRDAQPIDIGYTFEAVDSNGAAITRFNSNVTIEIPYDPAKLSGARESDLTPRYFDPTTGSWQRVESFTMDKSAHRVVMLVDHFTDFACMTANPGVYTQYLPVVLDAYLTSGW